MQMIHREDKHMIRNSHRSDITIRASQRAGSKTRTWWPLALLLPGLILMPSRAHAGTATAPATAIEYGLIATGIAIAIIAAVDKNGNLRKDIPTFGTELKKPENLHRNLKSW